MPRTARRPPAPPTTPIETLFLTPWTDLDTYRNYLSRARDFIGIHGDRRYSAATLGRILNASQALDNDQLRGRYPLPLITTAEQPVVFDDETETKSGGIIGMVLCWPGDRTVIAVNASKRRQGHGMALMDRLFYNIGRDQVILWVGRDNRVGHFFALDCNLFPSAMNSTGAVRYDSSTVEVDS